MNDPGQLANLVSPLHWATRIGSHEMVGMLLQAKANTNYRANNVRALDIANRLHPESTITALLHAMTQPAGDLNEEQTTALLAFMDQAAAGNSPTPALIQAIIEEGHSPNTVANNTQSFFYHAFTGQELPHQSPPASPEHEQILMPAGLAVIHEADSEDDQSQPPPDDEPLSKSANTTQSTQPLSSQGSSGDSQSPIPFATPY